MDMTKAHMSKSPVQNATTERNMIVNFHATNASLVPKKSLFRIPPKSYQLMKLSRLNMSFYYRRCPKNGTTERNSMAMRNGTLITSTFPSKRVQFDSLPNVRDNYRIVGISLDLYDVSGEESRKLEEELRKPE